MKEKEVNQEFIEEMNQHREVPAGKGLIETCSTNAILFSEKMLGVKLYSWQIYFIKKLERVMNEKDPVKKQLLNKRFNLVTSRQIGKSFVLAVIDLWALVYNKYPGGVSNNTAIGVVSASDQQAKKLLDEIKKMIIVGDKHMSTYKDDKGNQLFPTRKTTNGRELGFFSSLVDETRPNNTTTITFVAHNPQKHGPHLLAGSRIGSYVKSLPPTAVVLGETFSMVEVDEAGKSERISDQFYEEYLYPTGNSTDAIRINCSTPWQPSGFFYREVNPDGIHGETNVDVTVFTIEAIKIENPTYYATVSQTISEMRKDGKQDEVQRAYYCRFVKGEQSYFNPETIFALFTENYPKYETFNMPCDMGVDFGGQTTSKTVVTIAALGTDGIARRIHHWDYPVGKDETLLQDMEEALKKFNVQRIIPDDCPAGWHLIKKMQEKGWNVHPMNFRADKIKKYGGFRSMLNRGRIQSYKDDELQIEMLSLEFSQGLRQSIIQHAPGANDDMIDSFVMSCYFYIEEEDKFRVYSLEEAGETDPYA